MKKHYKHLLNTNQFDSYLFAYSYKKSLDNIESELESIHPLYSKSDCIDIRKVVIQNKKFLLVTVYKKSTHKIKFLYTDLSIFFVKAVTDIEGCILNSGTIKTHELTPDIQEIYIEPYTASSKDKIKTEQEVLKTHQYCKPLHDKKNVKKIKKILMLLITIIILCVFSYLLIGKLTKPAIKVEIIPEITKEQIEPEPEYETVFLMQTILETIYETKGLCTHFVYKKVKGGNQFIITVKNATAKEFESILQNKIKKISIEIPEVQYVNQNPLWSCTIFASEQNTSNTLNDASNTNKEQFLDVIETLSYTKVKTEHRGVEYISSGILQEYMLSNFILCILKLINSEAIQLSQLNFTVFQESKHGAQYAYVVGVVNRNTATEKQTKIDSSYLNTWITLEQLELLFYKNLPIETIEKKTTIPISIDQKTPNLIGTITQSKSNSIQFSKNKEGKFQIEKRSLK